MLDRDSVHREVLLLVAEIAELPAEKVTPESSFDELGIDSLNGLRIAAEMERRFGINIPDEVIVKFRSMRDIFALADSYTEKDK